MMVQAGGDASHASTDPGHPGGAAAAAGPAKRRLKNGGGGGGAAGAAAGLASTPKSAWGQPNSQVGTALCNVQGSFLVLGGGYSALAGLGRARWILPAARS